MTRRRAASGEGKDACVSPAQDAAAQDAAALELAADLDFSAARALHAALLPLRSRERVVLDASKVERMSTAGVLVLVSFLNARSSINPPAAVAGASGAFVDAFSDLGLFAALMRMEFLG